MLRNDVCLTYKAITFVNSNLRLLLIVQFEAVKVIFTLSYSCDLEMFICNPDCMPDSCKDFPASLCRVQESQVMVLAPHIFVVFASSHTLYHQALKET